MFLFGVILPTGLLHDIIVSNKARSERGKKKTRKLKIENRKRKSKKKIEKEKRILYVRLLVTPPV